MKTCNTCGLAFEQVDAKGNCQGCAAEATPPAPQRDPEVDALRKQLQATDARYRQIEQAIQQRPAAPVIPPDRAEINKQFYADPLAAVDQRAAAIANHTAQQLAAGFMAETQEMVVANAKREARGDDPEDQADFDRLLPQINERLASYAPAFLRNPQLWKNTFNVIRGEQIRQTRPAAEAKGPSFRIADGPASPSPRAASKPGKEPLDPMAIQIARKLRITDDEMRQGIADFNNQGDEKDSSKPSAWDRKITFNNRTGRHYPKETAATGSRA